MTVAEYESRAERYDKQLREKLALDPSAMTTLEKVIALKAYRQAQYQSYAMPSTAARLG